MMAQAFKRLCLVGKLRMINSVEGELAIKKGSFGSTQTALQWLNRFYAVMDD